MEPRNGRFPLLVGLEGAVLVAVAPFLLFPTLSPGGTGLALVSLAGLWLFLWVFTRQPFPHTPLNLAVLCFAVTVWVSINLTADPTLTTPKTTNLLLGLATWRFLAQLTNRPWWFASCYAFALVSLFFTITGALSVNWFAKYPLFAALLNRLPTLIFSLPESPEAGVHANQLAGVLLLHGPWWVSLAWGWRSSRFSRLFPAVLAFCLVSLLVLTQSRSGWLGGVAGILVLGWGWYTFSSASVPKRPFRWQLWGVLAVLALVSLFAWAAHPAWQSMAHDTRNAVGFRLEVWRWGLTAVHGFPFTGTGLGSFRQVARRLYPMDIPASYDISHAHNLFLQTALDIGLPGLIAYLAILGIAARIAWQTAKQVEELRPFALGLLASLVAFHTYGLTDALALGSKPGLLFWFILGLLAALAQQNKKHEN